MSTSTSFPLIVVIVLIALALSCRLLIIYAETPSKKPITKKDNTDMELIAVLIEYEGRERIIISTNQLTMFHLKEFLKVQYDFNDEEVRDLKYTNYAPEGINHLHGSFMFHGVKGTFRQIPVSTR